MIPGSHMGSGLQIKKEKRHKRHGLYFFRIRIIKMETFKKCILFFAEINIKRQSSCCLCLLVVKIFVIRYPGFSGFHRIFEALLLIFRLRFFHRSIEAFHPLDVLIQVFLEFITPLRIYGIQFFHGPFQINRHPCFLI